MEAEQGWAQVLQTVTSARGALSGEVGEIIELHIRQDVVDEANSTNKQRSAMEDLIKVVRAYVK